MTPSSQHSVNILPMKTAGTQHFIERTYREGGALQWVREAYINAEEAGAKHIEFGVEWQAVESMGVYRRVIADDGRGMNGSELVGFFNTFGGGGKPIGGVHENFGVGAKTSLLPWNRHGIVVVSWVDGDASMIWLERDPETGEYGLQIVDAEDPETGDVTREVVYAPYDDSDEYGCDWEQVKPEWMGDHGTVVVLLGNDPKDDTVQGDPHRNEGDIKGISAYLNRRLWEIPNGVQVVVDELRSEDKAKWPRGVREAHGSPPKAGQDRRTNQRTIKGARHFIEYRDKAFTKGSLKASGHVLVSGNVEIDWYLWDGERPAVQSYASISGFIAALYRNELFDFNFHPSLYRSFGISEGSVRSRVWLIVSPPEFGGDGRGVYPRTDRNALLLKGGPSAGEPLPFSDWAAEFADQMPEALIEAIRGARTGQVGTLDDAEWRQRLADRFGARWRITKLRAQARGAETVRPVQAGTAAKPQTIKRVVLAPAPRTGKARTSGGRTGSPNIGGSTGSVPAAKLKVAGGIPRFRAVGKDSVTEGMLAAWQPNDPEYPEGCVLINTEHPVLCGEIEYWQSQYPGHHAEEIRKDVVDIYGQIAVAKIAHSEHMKGLLPSQVVDNELRSEAALTMGLLGLIAEEAVIATRVGGKYGKRRAAI
jgi:hypothetical protein